MEALCKFVKIEYKHPFTPLAGANRKEVFFCWFILKVFDIRMANSPFVYETAD